VRDGGTENSPEIGTFCRCVIFLDQTLTKPQGFYLVYSGIHPTPWRVGIL